MDHSILWQMLVTSKLGVSRCSLCKVSWTCTYSVLLVSKFHPALMYIMLDLLPQRIFFRSAIQAREVLVKAFAKYYNDGSYKLGSAYVQRFTEHFISQKMPDDDIPRFLMGTVFTTVANSAPSAFWVIYRIFSDPVILQNCRREVEKTVTHSQENTTSTINLSLVLNACPTLLSTYNEVFRYHGMANLVRIVAEDQVLGGYQLKKGGIVMISARAQQSNAEVWGQDVDAFNHKRFVKQAGHKCNPTAFRGFGGGTTLCPGRHFATSEILLLTTLLILRFDIEPTSLPWVMPSTAKSSHAEAMEQPDEDIAVRFTPWPDARGRTWNIEFSGTKNAETFVQQ